MLKLTKKREVAWEYGENTITVHSEQYTEVNGQAPPHIEMIHSSPVISVESNLGKKKHPEKAVFKPSKQGFSFSCCYI